MSKHPSAQSPAPEPEPAVRPVINEVRYSLPELLAELQAERTTGAFAQEKLHQIEIGKIFKNRRKHRAKTSP